jgi:hypothetical protein
MQRLLLFSMIGLGLAVGANRQTAWVRRCLKSHRPFPPRAFGRTSLDAGRIRQRRRYGEAGNTRRPVPPFAQTGELASVESHERIRTPAPLPDRDLKLLHTGPQEPGGRDW